MMIGKSVLGSIILIKKKEEDRFSLYTFFLICLHNFVSFFFVRVLFFFLTLFYCAIMENRHFFFVSIEI